MESSIMEEAYKELERLSQDLKTQRLAEFRERELKDIMQREYDAREDGKEQEKKEIALNLVERGFSLNEIVAITGLSLDQLSKLVESNS